MSVIGLAGPHAIGKTTACYRWLDRYRGMLLAAIADSQCEAGSREDRQRVREWKGTVEQKTELVRKHSRSPGVTVIDSVRTTALNYFDSESPVIIVTCRWEVMDRLLRGRCERNGKKFNEKYWTKDKLDYESHRRYLNYAAKRLTPGQWHHFWIEDQARDWPAVDECFGRLFRKLWNQRHRKVR